MQSFNFHIALDAADARLVEAVAATAGQSDVRLLGTWWGTTHDGRETLEEETGAVNIEWLLRKGRFALDVRVYGPGLSPRETEARFVRALAIRLGRAILFSDCGLFPLAYFMAAPDGGILYVLIRDDEDSDVIDLASDDHFAPELIIPAGEALPLKPDDAPLPKARKAYCDRGDHNDPTLICEQFWGICPKRRGIAAPHG
jgi:hypothetical protein